MEKGDKARPPTGRWVVERLVHLLYEVLRDTDPDAARTSLVGVSLGVVTALKLLVRLETCGTTVLTAVPEGIDAIEEFSDELAEELFDQLAGEVFGLGALHHRLCMARFTRTDNTLTFRLAPPRPMDQTTPAEFHDVFTLSSLADGVVGRMMTLLECTMRTLDGRAVVLGKIAFIVGFAALAKILMGYWGPGRLASGIETIAELDSDSRYRELLARASEN